MFTPDGRIIVVRGQGAERALYAADPSSGRVRPLTRPDRYYGGVNMSSDRRRFVFLSSTDSTPRLYIGRLDGSTPPLAITPQGSTSYEAAWSPDGGHVAFYSDQTGTHELYIVDKNGRGLRQLTGRR